MALNINTRDQLLQFCLRKLGKPVIEINLSCEQEEDRIDEALSFFQEYHDDAMTKVYRVHEVTQDDIDNEYILLPNNISTIVQVLPMDDQSSNWTSFKYQYAQTDMLHLWRNGGGMDLTSHSIAQSYYSLMNMQMGSGQYVVTEFNRYSNKLELLGMDLVLGQEIVIEAWEILDPADIPNIYGDALVVQYATQLLKQNWGVNLKKFEGMQLPGGLTFNGQQIYDEATEAILKLEEEVQLKYSAPPRFFVG